MSRWVTSGVHKIVRRGHELAIPSNHHSTNRCLPSPSRGPGLFQRHLHVVLVCSFHIPWLSTPCPEPCLPALERARTALAEDWPPWPARMEALARGSHGSDQQH